MPEHRLHVLTAITIANLKQPGRYADGGGLYLEVDQHGRRWLLRLRTPQGTRRDFGLGSLHKVPLALARERAASYRAKIQQGLDPLAGKKAPAPKTAPSFEECARAAYEKRKANWSNGKHVEQWINTLTDYAFPMIGQKPVDRVTTADALAILEPIWLTKAETARRVRQRLYTVLDWARAAGHRSGDNPVDLIGDALPKHKSTSKKHHAALPYKDVSVFIGKLRSSGVSEATKLAFEFLILTAARTLEVRHALWDEIDADLTTWSIPGHDEATGRRMKSGRDHIVPLSPRAAEILQQARTLSRKTALIFPDTDTGKPMSENRFLIARDAIGYKDVCTPHGFRSSFRDWASEETNFPPDVAEMALAHTIKSKAEAAYRRGHLLAKRREMMDAWADYVRQ